MERTKNALLFVIALCLVLIVLKLYSSDNFVREAQAQPGTGSMIYGCFAPQGAAECQPKAVHVTANGALVVFNSAR